MEHTLLTISFWSLLSASPVVTPPAYLAPEPPTQAVVQVIEEKPEVKEPPIVQYTVQSGDSLTSIAEKYGTIWQRLWHKNTQLQNQDSLTIGEILTIPTADEVLAERAVITPTPAPTTQSEPVRSSNAISGNTYTYGYCTWYVKNRRPDLPNSLGNANTWYARYGGSKGSTPAVGAVGTTTYGALGHVVYVEAVNTDGTILISEMNYTGWGVQSSRLARASEFLYIY